MDTVFAVHFKVKALQRWSAVEGLAVLMNIGMFDLVIFHLV